MSETKFTPGPWEFYSDAFEECGVKATNNPAGNDGWGFPIAKVNGDWREVPEYGSPFANANLIAAAPELYEALVGMTDLLKNHAPTVWRHKKEYIDALEALAKARGEV